MKKILSISLLLCVLLTGCHVPTAHTEMAIPATDYESMEIYQFLQTAVTEEASLEEILDAFAAMCEIPVDTTTEMFLYEVYPSEFNEEKHLNVHIVRQVDEPGTDEFIQLHLDILYLLDEDMERFKETTWYDRDAEGFVEHIRSGAIYQTLIRKPIHEQYVSIGSTW